MRQRHPAKSARVVVIGAGPGGLAISLLLARAGLRVTVVERQPRVGGRTSAVEADGFRFDLGATFFVHPRPLARVLAAVGRDLRAEIPMVRLDPQYRLVFGGEPGGTLDATPDLDRMERAVAALCPADAAQLRRFLDDNRAKLARIAPALERPFLGWRGLFEFLWSRSTPRTMLHIRPGLSLDAELRRYFTDPRIRAAFAFQSKYLGMSPVRCPSLFSILSFLEYEHGVFHPIGGCASVSERLAAIAAEMGVEIRLGEPAREILFEGRKAVGVRTDRGDLPADRVVLNADFARGVERLVPDRLRRRWTDAKVARKRFSCSTFMMYLGIEGLEGHLEHHTIALSGSYDADLRAIESEHRTTDDPTVYVQNACATDPSLAPPGMSTLYVLAPVTHQHPNVDWSTERDRFRAVVMRQLRDRLGIRDLERRIRFEKVVTPRDWDREYEIYRGATFNLAHDLGQLLLFRPQNRFEDVEGMYLVGGGTHPGSGLPVIFESARIGARLLLSDLELDHAWIDDPAPAAATPAAWRSRSPVTT